MRRFNQPLPPSNSDFQLQNFAGTSHRITFNFGGAEKKIPIHYRTAGKKPGASSAHDLASEGLTLGNEEEVSQNREPRSAQNKGQKSGTFLPGDRVIFAENPSAPGVPVVYRTPEERASNPDRLNLDRRKLTVCPILEGEDQLRLLNYQHNSITQIQHLSSLRRLIFLDLYDNEIEQICGLSSLKSLRVLMLGKNKIKKIENLDALLKLDVLDLHGNQISKIENLGHLSELRVLNLAGNQIIQVDNMSGIDALAELNLRRNKIRTVVDVDNLPNLQRLFLSFNEINCFEDVQCLGDSTSLSEICLDGNPIAQDPSYKQIILRNMQQLKQLDMKRVSEEERRLAVVMARKEEEKRRELNKIAILKEKRRLAINNAKRHWETMQGSLISRTSKLVRAPEGSQVLYANHLGSLPTAADMFTSPVQQDDESEYAYLTSNDKRHSRPGSAYSSLTDLSQDSNREHERPRTSQRRVENKSAPKETVIFGSEGVSGGSNMVADLEEDTLNLYGPLALGAFDRNWGLQAAGAVTTIFFKFIDFDEICKHLHKVRSRFPSTQNLVLSNTNLHSLQQINALAAVRTLDHLTIDLDGNPVTKFTVWRLFTVFRLAHIGLKKINDVEVSPADIINAERLFGPLAQVITSHYRLSTVVGETRKKPVTTGGEEKPRKEGKGDKAHTEQQARAPLVYLPPDLRTGKLDGESKKDFSRTYLQDMLKEATFADRKRVELARIWPSIFYSMVQAAVSQMLDAGSYAKTALDNLDNS